MGAVDPSEVPDVGFHLRFSAAYRLLDFILMGSDSFQADFKRIENGPHDCRGNPSK